MLAHDEESERQVLGGMIFWGYDVVNEIRAVCPPEAFFERLHQEAARVIYKMAQEKVPIGAGTVGARLKEAGVKVPEMSAYEWSGQAVNWNCTRVEAFYHARMVRDRARTRKALESAENARGQIAAGEDPELILAALEAARASIVPCVPSVSRDLDEIALAHPVKHWEEEKRDLTGLSSGLRGLDDYTLGFQESDLIYLAGRPGMGKTALALQMGKHAARQGHRVFVASLEMKDHALFDRLHSHECGVGSYTLRRGGLKGDLMTKAVLGMGTLSKLPMTICDPSSLTPSQLISEMKEKGFRKGLLIVDYVQLMMDDIRHDSDHSRVSAISRQLKSIAREFECVALVLAQLKRPPHGSEQRRPYLSDLKDSGSLEQDADVVLFIHGEAHSGNDSKRQVQLIVEKQRNGPTGDFNLTFARDTGEFA